MLTCFNVQKTHYFSNTVHYCSSSMPRLYQTCRLWLAKHHKHASECNAPTIIASFSFQVSFISSSPKGEQSRVTDTVMMLVCICSAQAAVKTISDGLYTLLWCDPVPLTHTHDALRAKLLLETNSKTYLQSLSQKRQIVIAMSVSTLFFLEIAFVHSQPCTLLGSRNCRP